MTTTRTTVKIIIEDTEMEASGIWDDGAWDGQVPEPEWYKQEEEAAFYIEGLTIGGVNVWDLASAFERDSDFPVDSGKLIDIAEEKAFEQLLRDHGLE